MVEKNERKSEIELLKIIAMILIVISHIAQTYGSPHVALHLKSGYFININSATKNINDLITIFFKYFGAIGNDIFFIVSAWFLLDSKKCKAKKIFQIVIDTWLISIIILALFIIFYPNNISKSNILKGILPITTQSNWYITCYILFYLIHMGLNIIIGKINQKQHLSFNILLIVLYGIICTLDSDVLYFTHITEFIMIYLIVAYAKKYMNNTISNQKTNKKILIISTISLIALILITNILGLKVSFLHNKMTHWAKGNNPLIILIAFSLFNIFRSKNFVNKTINKWSSMTLLIYVLHENVIFRTYLRPYIFVFIKDTFGYKYIVLWIIAISIILFLISSLIGLIYTKTIQKITRKIANKLEILYYNIIDKLTEKIMKIN